jgi:predicted nucleic acid-binding protein
MSKSPWRAVCDTGPVIHLDELGCIELLDDFTEILLPRGVKEEIDRHRPACLERSLLGYRLEQKDITPREPLATMCRLPSLDRGDVEALALMERIPRSLFLTDDAAARVVSAQVGFRVHGTIGIVIRSIRRGQRQPEEVLSILESIPARSTLHVRPSLLEEIIGRVREESKPR